jgi:hypothetical protein
MKKSEAHMVPVLEDALELNLPKLMRAAKAAGSGRLILDDGVVRTVVVLSETRLAASLGGRAWVADIVAVGCLGGRLRPLLRCPRAHEGNFQSLYFENDVLACRHCHRLRYRSNLAASSADRAWLSELKLLQKMGNNADLDKPQRLRSKPRRLNLDAIKNLGKLRRKRYAAMRTWLENKK